MNKIEQATALANEMLSQHSVKGWKVQITNTRKTLAVTDYRTQTVELSKRFILISTLEQFVGIMGHEIAHILVGRGHGHGEKFVEMCRKIGVDEARSCEQHPFHIKLYKYVCDVCGVVGSSEKQEDGVCISCLKSTGKIIDLQVIKNKIEVTAW